MEEKVLEDISAVPGLQGLDEFYQLFSLSDEDFGALAPIVLDSLKQSFAKPEDKLVFTQALNAEGMYAEDFAEKVKELSAQLEDELGDKFSKEKIDFLIEAMTIVSNVVNETEGIAKRTIQVPIKRLSKDAYVPQYAHLGDGAVDLYSPIDFVLKPGETKIIPLGFSISLPKGYGALIQSRSGLSAKTKLRVANAPGLVDSNFRGEVGVILENTEPAIKDLEVDYDEKGNPIIKSVLFGQSLEFSKGDRIAQMRLVETPSIMFVKTTELDDTERGEGGFGSSGISDKTN